MQIKSLWIKEYKNLKDFRINFEHQVSVLIGANGAGKSNILDVIVLIFKDLYGANKFMGPGFQYQIIFKINGKEINISYKENEFGEEDIGKNIIVDRFDWVYGIFIDGEKKDETYLGYELEKTGRSEILPKNIIIYNSGYGINRNFGKINSKFIVNPLFELSNTYFKITLLSFFYSDIESHKKFLNDKINIKDIFSFNIKYDKTKFKKNPNSYKFEQLVEFTITGREMRSGLLEFSGDILKFGIFRNFIGYGKDFFNLLYLAKEDGIIKDIEIKINILGANHEINVNDLSEGQKQLLTTNGISEFLSDEENLFLFDEPDTFLHPNWQKDFIPSLIDSQEYGNLLTENGDRIITESGEGILVKVPIKSHFIITTHSPLLVGSSENIDIVGLENKGGKTEILCHTNPELFEENESIEKIDVYGNRAEFIYEKVFSLESTRALKFDEDIIEINNFFDGIINKKGNEKAIKSGIVNIKEKLEKLTGNLKDDINDPYNKFEYLLDYLNDKY